MFAVNVYQYILEWFNTFSFMLFFLGMSLVFGGKNNTQVVFKAWRIFVGFTFTILNGFYLLGDFAFQRHVRTDGVWKALQKALLQKYE